MTQLARRSPPVPPVDPPLRDGLRLSRAEFHRRYEAMPDVRAELIGGVVHMASPMGRPHGDMCGELYTAVRRYAKATPGVKTGLGATVLLDDRNEPEPDIDLRVLEEFGGRSRVTDDEFLQGPPELAIEVADSTARKDLTLKRPEYAGAGILEYWVLVIRKKALRAFDLVADVELPHDPDGVFRSRVFPGLWIDPVAILAEDSDRVAAVIDLGLASPEHAAFVLELEKRRKAKRPAKKSKRTRE